MTTDGIKDALTIAGGVTLLLGVLWRIVVIPNLRREFGAPLEATRKAVTENNGGSSMPDRMDKQDRAIADLARKVEQHLHWSEEYVAGADKRADRLDERLANIERMQEDS